MDRSERRRMKEWKQKATKVTRERQQSSDGRKVDERM